MKRLTNVVKPYFLKQEQFTVDISENKSYKATYVNCPRKQLTLLSMVTKEVQTVYSLKVIWSK